MENQMGIVVMLLTGVSLAMDAFAVSISCGLSCQKVKSTLPTAIKIGLSFGFFQGMMMLLGWVFALSFRDFISTYDHWVAFIVLAALGGKMMHDAAENQECAVSLTGTGMLLTLSIATSIDALAVGVSFAVLNISLISISLGSLVVAVITFIFCFSGTYMGSKIGCNPKFKTKIDMTGGLILIILGIKILLEGTMLA